MPGASPGGKSDVFRIVEKQMRNWELARAQRVESPPDTQPAEQTADFVCISRTVGSGGSRVGTLLGERLGWPVFDREILQAMAGDDRVRAQLYEEMDERDESWLEETLRWVIGGELRQEDYFYRLTETVLAIARQGPAVFLGRAVDQILPPERGLRLRITAPRARRVATLSQRDKLSEEQAQAEVERIDRERDEFRKQHFGKTADDPADYDLTLNLDRLLPELAVDVIIAALRARAIIA